MCVARPRLEPRSPALARALESALTAIDRPLTDAERACWLIDQERPFTIVFVAHVAGPLDPEALRRALDALAAAYPPLRVAVEPGPRARFRECGRAVPLRVLPRHGDDDWQAALAEDRAAPLDAAGPLARLTAVRGAERSELLLTVHHGVSDGMSGVFLTRDLLTAVARIQAGQPADLPAHPPLPGVEDLLPAAARGLVGLLARGRYLLGQLWTLLRRPRKLDEAARLPIGARVSRTRHLRIDAPTTAALQARCRAQGTTVHGAIVAVGLRALAGQLGARALLGCCSPVDLRRRLRPSLGEAVGLYVGPVVHFHEVAPDADLWALAREVRAALRGAVEAGGPAVALATQSAMLPRRATPALASGLLYHPLFGALAVTNMGAPDIPAVYGPLTLERLHIASPTAPLGSLVSFAVLTMQGEISLNVNYNEDIVPEPLIDAIVASALAGLRSMAGPPAPAPSA